MINLKTILPLILIAMSVTCIQAQDVVNMLSCNDYEVITFNDKTIEQINATNAEHENLQYLFGNYSSVDELGENRSRAFNYGDNRIGFTYDVQTLVTRITIVNDEWSVVIQDNSIKVGDSLASLEESFGDELIIGESQYVSYSFVAFGCPGKDTGINLELDPITNTVRKIVYFVSP
ncbi:MAG: hypothetical protein JJU46_09720 [Balneolaceae bacterium]|nr:hypothetical protein [Balneolaceae bacterium]